MSHPTDQGGQSLRNESRTRCTLAVCSMEAGCGLLHSQVENPQRETVSIGRCCYARRYFLVNHVFIRFIGDKVSFGLQGARKIMSDREREIESQIVSEMDRIRADRYPLVEYDNIGRRGLRRIDGYEKASGKALYTMDVQLPGMLCMRFLTSPYPHARILSMDTSKAEKLPGVRAVLRYDDPELPPIAELGGHGPSHASVLPHIAHFQGEEVGAAVAADTEEIALRALRLIEVEWEERPFVLDVEEALDADAPLANPELHPEGNLYNEGWRDVEELGDVEKGLHEADAVIEFTARRRLHTWIGPERPCGVVRWNGEYPEVWVKQQRPHISKRVISTWFGGIPMNRIQLHCLYQGASFGGWSQVAWNMGGTYCAALVAKRTGRPVKWTFDRREDFYGGEMDEGVYHFTVGAKKDGTITAVKGQRQTFQPLLSRFRFRHPFSGEHKDSEYIWQAPCPAGKQGRERADTVRAEPELPEPYPCLRPYSGCAEARPDRRRFEERRLPRPRYGVARQPERGDGFSEKRQSQRVRGTWKASHRLGYQMASAR